MFIWIFLPSATACSSIDPTRGILPFWDRLDRSDCIRTLRLCGGVYRQSCADCLSLRPIGKCGISWWVFWAKKGLEFQRMGEWKFWRFHGDALWSIKIRFAKEVAKRAEKVQFHPSQKVSHGRNGSLVMELRCRGHRELIWELMHPDWLGFVQIESPDRLKEEYAEQLERAKLAV